MKKELQEIIDAVNASELDSELKQGILERITESSELDEVIDHGFIFCTSDYVCEFLRNFGFGYDLDCPEATDFLKFHFNQCGKNIPYKICTEDFVMLKD